jgi:ATP-dependent DNA ligase
MVRRDAAGVRLLTRNGYNWSTRFPAILEAESALQAHSCLIDGEAVAPLKKIPPAEERGGICRRTDAGEGQVHRVAPT